MSNLLTIHIKSEDLPRMRECKAIYQKYHPESRKFKISDIFILSECIRKYYEDDKK